jgi:hypothetical protein
LTICADSPLRRVGAPSKRIPIGPSGSPCQVDPRNAAAQ